MFSKERANKFSPPVTRSAKKKKLQRDFVSTAETKQKDGVLWFSPPDQAENARREKLEREKKFQER